VVDTVANPILLAYNVDPRSPLAMIQLIRDPIDPAAVLDSVRSTNAGAVCLFLGTVREFTASRQTRALTYEAYAGMAEAKLAELEAKARDRWPVVALTIVHRLGDLELGDIAVAVAVSTPHRGDAFAACQWLMDTIKQVVPIWKQEIWADGSREWVHPGLPPAADPSA
jgi:molybdopterin synthase catalytic subunit